MSVARVGGALLLMAAASACISGPHGRAESSEPQLDLTLTSLDGRSLELAALRGRPALVFLFATYDASSQLALAPLVAVSETEDRLTFVGVAVQPDAKVFLEPFRNALDIPFELYFDASDALLQGRTALGKLPGVPAFVALDASGHVRKTYFGVASREELRSLIASAL